MTYDTIRIEEPLHVAGGFCYNASQRPRSSPDRTQVSLTGCLGFDPRGGHLLVSYHFLEMAEVRQLVQNAGVVH